MTKPALTSPHQLALPRMPSAPDDPAQAAQAARLRALLLADARRLALLRAAAALALPDCWIAAGFVRNAVWDHLAGRAPAPPDTDIDVIWFDRPAAGPAHPGLDLALAQRLRALEPAADWSVKHQGRMHRRNGDPPYADATDAMRHWPETATATGVRLGPSGDLEIAAPYGLDDLFAGIVRPTPGFRTRKRDIFDARLAAKGWLARWPMLRLAVD